jgi:hypothetical protein
MDFGRHILIKARAVALGNTERAKGGARQIAETDYFGGCSSPESQRSAYQRHLPRAHPDKER